MTDAVCQKPNDLPIWLYPLLPFAWAARLGRKAIGGPPNSIVADGVGGFFGIGCLLLLIIGVLMVSTGAVHLW